MKKRVIVQIILLLAIVVCCNYNIDVVAGYVKDEEYIIDEDSVVEEEEEDLSQYDWIVAKDGSGHFTTIQEACEAASDGDSIYIKNGTYYEWVVPGNREEYIEYLVYCWEFEKNLSLIGESRDGVILQYNYSNYFCAPLFMNEGSITNMTIYASSSGDTSSSDSFMAELNEYVDDQKSTLDANDPTYYSTYKKKFDGTFGRAYAIHIDSYEGLYDGNRFTLKISNCTFKADAYNAVGMGLHSGDSVTFTNCTFYSPFGGGTAYIHDLQVADDLGSNYRASTLSLTSVTAEGNLPTIFSHVGSTAKTNLYLIDVVFESGLSFVNEIDSNKNNSFEDIKYNLFRGDYVAY